MSPDSRPVWPSTVSKTKGVAVDIADGRVTPKDGWPPNLPDDIIYVIGVSDGAFHRIGGDSSVLYVGQGRRQRLDHLSDGTHSCRQALAHAVAGLPPGTQYEVRIKGGGGYSGLLETAALTEITLTVGELPPANIRWESWLCYRVPTLLAHWAHSKTWAPYAVDEPEENARGCWVHRYSEDDEWEYSIGCLYPSDWAQASGQDTGLILIEPADTWDHRLVSLLNRGRADWTAHHAAWKPGRLRAHIPIVGLAGEQSGQDVSAWVDRLIAVIARRKNDELEGAAWLAGVFAELGDG